VADATDDASGLAVVVPMMVVAIVLVMMAVSVRAFMSVTVIVLMPAMIVTMIVLMSAMVMVVMPAMVVGMMVITMMMVMAVTMMVLVRRRVAVIGLEWRRHRLRLEAAFLEEKRDLRRAGDAQAIGENLHRHVAVAEREDEPRGPGEILLAHLRYLFDLGDDLDQPAVVEQQEVVGAQERRRWEIELDAGALAAKHEAPLLDAVLVFEQHGIDDVARRFSRADDFLGARHGMIRF
jgi:C4-dicarboxylate-specific signal transduction histidine kinase